MSRMRLFICIAVTISFSIAYPPSLSAQRLVGREFASSVNLIERDAKIEGLLFVPQGVMQIAGVVVILNYGRLSDQLYDDDDLRRVLQQTSCAAVFARITNIQPQRPDEPIASQLIRNAAAGGGDGLLLLLRRFGSETKHQELRDAPILLWEWSAAASFGTTFAAMHAERTIGFVRYHTHRRGLSEDLRPLKQIPALLIAGGKDETAGVGDSERFWQLGRAAGAPWTFAIEPDSPHSSPEIHEQTAKALTIPWIAGTLQQRLGRKSLQSIRDDSGWLADARSFSIGSYDTFAGEKATASWLPDEASSRGWQTVVQPVVRPAPVDPISGTWQGNIVIGTNRVPVTLELKFDGNAVTSASMNMGGVVGDTDRGVFDPKNGLLKFELDAKPAANPNAATTHFVLEGVVFEGTATGRVEATNQTTALTARFLVTRK